MDKITPVFRWAERARDTVAPAAVATEHDNLVDLAGGKLIPDAMPDIVSEAIAAAEVKAETLQYGPLYGLDDLRDTVAAYLARDGIAADRETILIVNGAKHGLDLACRVFVGPGEPVIVAAPTYLTAVHILKHAEASFIPVPQDEEGMDADILESKLHTLRNVGAPMPKLLFDVPDFHNPTGITMSAARRQRLVAMAEEYDFVIVEDDPYRRIRFEGERVPPIKSFDKNGRVIGLGTVSKILAPGLRIGWVNADPAIVRRMASHKSDHGTCPLLQRIVVQLFRNGKVDEHVATITALLRKHRDVMISAIRKHMPGASVRTPEGGYFLWVGLPPEIDADELVRRSDANGVRVFAGQLSFAEAAPGQFVRLAYSFNPPARITEGVQRLASVYTAMQAEGAVHASR